jgi:hypothetical protein
MLRDGIKQKTKALTVKDLAFKDTVRKIETGTEVGLLLAELKRLGWLKSYIQKETPGAVDFVSFLKTFWDWEKSPYISEKLRREHGIHLL